MKTKKKERNLYDKHAGVKLLYMKYCYNNCATDLEGCQETYVQCNLNYEG